MKEPGFKSWVRHVPTLIHVDQDSWNRIVRRMMDVISPEVDFYVSDMYVLHYLHQHFSEEEIGITLWTDETTNLFPFVKGGACPEIDCVVATSRLAAHLSHFGTSTSYQGKTYPEIEGVVVKEGEHAEYRAQAADVIMKDYKAKSFMGRNGTLLFTDEKLNNVRNDSAPVS